MTDPRTFDPREEVDARQQGPERDGRSQDPRVEELRGHDIVVAARTGQQTGRAAVAALRREPFKTFVERMEKVHGE